jgi:hypothetical protein
MMPFGIMINTLNKIGNVILREVAESIMGQAMDSATPLRSARNDTESSCAKKRR